MVMFLNTNTFSSLNNSAQRCRMVGCFVNTADGQFGCRKENIQLSINLSAGYSAFLIFFSVSN